MNYKLDLCLLLAFVFLFAGGSLLEANPLIEAASSADTAKVQILLANDAS
jgi:hypothetical protein